MNTQQSNILILFSISMRSAVRIIPQPPGKIETGEVLFKGRDLLKVSEEEMRKIRGNDIAMIFQDPMTSLNPVLTIGRQIAEMVMEHKGLGKKAANGSINAPFQG